MKREEIIANNKLIAEFLGFVNTTPNDRDFDIMEHPTTKKLVEPASMKHHKSWDELMPVVEKINKELYLIDILYTLNSTKVLIKLNYNNEIIAEGYTESFNSLDAVYNAVVQFIKWWNENNS